MGRRIVEDHNRFFGDYLTEFVETCCHHVAVCGAFKGETVKLVVFRVEKSENIEAGAPEGGNFKGTED